jgi:hypothetical protein
VTERTSGRVSIEGLDKASNRQTRMYLVARLRLGSLSAVSGKVTLTTTVVAGGDSGLRAGLSDVAD